MTNSEMSEEGTQIADGTYKTYACAYIYTEM